MSMSVMVGGLNKSYAGRRALDGVSCVFEPGIITAVVGPNGSGKTTLLRIAAMLESMDGGSVAYTDGDSAVQPGLSLMRRVTYVSQAPVLFNTSVRENIAYGLKARGLTKHEVALRVDEAIATGGIGHLSESDARRLSGGEAQRVALVRAYALKPEAAFLDEPTSNLDPSGVAAMEALIMRMRDEDGAAVVIVTHNIFQARRIADRVVFLHEGRVVESGGAPEFFASPQNGLTRRFLSGEMAY